jgi:hypothetical protein
MTVLENVNAEIDRLFLLDGAIKQSLAYRSIVDELVRRELPVLADPHLDHIRVVRSAALRSLMLASVAVVEPVGERDDRASIGHILSRLNKLNKTSDLSGIFQNQNFTGDLRDAINAHKACCRGEDYSHVREIRDNAIAHVLDGIEDIPKVDYDAVFRLHDTGKVLAQRLFDLTRRGSPDFLRYEKHAKLSAKAFWDVYLFGATYGIGFQLTDGVSKNEAR